MTETVETRINGRWTLRLPPHRAKRPQWRTGWEVRRLDSMADLIDPGMVVYDVGAEEGDISALCAMWSGPVPLPDFDDSQERVAGGGVVLFEPNPSVWPNIRTIFEANGLPTPLGCFVGFAGDFDRPQAPTMYSRWPDCADGPVIGDHGFCDLWKRDDIEVARIDLVAHYVAPPDAITIDVEGAELRVLLGAQGVLREHRPLVWVSVHDRVMRNAYPPDTPTDLMAVMLDLGYRGRYLGTDHEEHWLFLPEERA